MSAAKETTNNRVEKKDTIHHHATHDNPWETVPVPLSDILLQDLAPNYLTMQDLVHWSMVSRRYKELLGVSSSFSGADSGNNSSNSNSTLFGGGNRILATILKRQCTGQINGSSMVAYEDQLPTIGNLSVEESLQEDPVLVAQLHKPAMRRRRLIRLHYPLSVNKIADDEQQRQEIMRLRLQELVSQFRPKTQRELAQKLREQNAGVQDFRQPMTSFICVNHSGQDIYCHWIDHDSHMTVREGDCVPSVPNGATGTNNTMLHSYQIEDRQELPAHVFCHTSVSSHSFALCFTEGGSPFAIYQQRRSWYPTRTGEFSTRMPTHAIQILPGGIVKEVHCEYIRCRILRRLNAIIGNFLAYLYQFSDRDTGVISTQFAPTPEGTGSHNNEGNDGGGSTSTNTGTPTASDVIANNLQGRQSNAKALAREFYGIDVPPITDPFWAQDIHLRRCPINPLGEVSFHD